MTGPNNFFTMQYSSVENQVGSVDKLIKRANGSVIWASSSGLCQATRHRLEPLSYPTFYLFFIILLSYINYQLTVQII